MSCGFTAKVLQHLLDLHGDKELVLHDENAQTGERVTSCLNGSGLGLARRGRFVPWEGQLATQSFLSIIQYCLAVQLMDRAAFDKLATESAAGRRLHRRTARFDPAQADLRLVAGVIPLPAHVECSVWCGKRPVFRSIGRQLVQDHGQRDAGLRPQGELRTVHRDPFANSAIRLQRPSHELAHIAARPARIDQEVVRAGERVQPAMGRRLEAL